MPIFGGTFFFIDFYRFTFLGAYRVADDVYMCSRCFFLKAKGRIEGGTCTLRFSTDSFFGHPDFGATFGVKIKSSQSSCPDPSGNPENIERKLGVKNAISQLFSTIRNNLF